LKTRAILTVRGPEEKADDQAAKKNGPDLGVNAGHHGSRLSHAAKIGSNVEDVRGYQQKTGAPKNPSRIIETDNCSEASSRDHAKTAAHYLHADH